MSFTRAKPSGWAFGEKLLSGQMNTIDTNLANAVDVTNLGLGSTVAVSRINPFLPSIDDPAVWSTLNQNNGYITANALGAACFWPLRLPHGAILTQIAVVIEPPSGHVALPASPPSFSVGSIQANGTLTTEVSNTFDSSASVGAYQTVHAITRTSLSLAINNTTKRYFVYVVTEFGANGVTASKVYLNSYSYTITALDKD